MAGLGQRFVIGLMALAVVGVASAAPAKAPATFECDMEVRTDTYGIVDRAKLTTKGNFMRLQKRTGAGLKLLFIRNRQGSFQLNMHTNDGAKLPAEQAKQLERRLITMGPQGDPWVFFKAVGAKRTGREKVNGSPVDVYRYSLPVTSGESQVVRVYMGVKEKRPLKVAARMEIAQGRFDTVTIDYKVYRWNFPLPDSFFSLPPGAKLVDLSKPDGGYIIVPGGPKRAEKPAPTPRRAERPRSSTP